MAIGSVEAQRDTFFLARMRECESVTNLTRGHKMIGMHATVPYLADATVWSGVYATNVAFFPTWSPPNTSGLPQAAPSPCRLLTFKSPPWGDTDGGRPCRRDARRSTRPGSTQSQHLPKCSRTSAPIRFTKKQLLDHLGRAAERWGMHPFAQETVLKAACELACTGHGAAK